MEACIRSGDGPTGRGPLPPPPPAGRCDRRRVQRPGRARCPLPPQPEAAHRPQGVRPARHPGCTRASRVAGAGAEVFGLSTQDPDYQSEAADRLGLPYSLLSDADLTLASAMRLPTFEVGGTTLLRRLTMVLRDGRVDRVLYPVFPPDRAAADALAALRA